MVYLLSSRSLFHLFSLESAPIMLSFSQSTSTALVKVIRGLHADKSNGQFSVFILLDL